MSTRYAGSGTRHATAIVLLVLLTSCRLAYAQDNFWIAAVNSEAELVPVGRYESGRWSNPWPAPDAFSRASVRSVADIPAAWWGGRGSVPPDQWGLWTSNGDRESVRLLRPAFRPGSCRRYWRVLTDYPRAARDQFIQQVGLASDVEIAVAPLSAWGAESEEWKRIQKVLGHRLDARSPIRATSPPTLRVTGSRGRLRSGNRLAYAEWLIPGADRHLVLASGWLIESAAGSWILAGDFARHADEDAAQVPIAVFVVGDDLHALSYVGHKDGSHYEIQRIRRGGVTVMVTKEASQC